VAGIRTPNATAAELVRLDWECSHFGYPVARLAGSDLDHAGLASNLRLARREGIRLVVWPAPDEYEAPLELLGEFNGALVDRKATFSRPLAIDPENHPGPACQRRSLIVPYTLRTATRGLIELAIAAGTYSRFRVDPHFSPASFEAMYRQWIERSVSGTLADRVLVAPRNARDSVHNELAGMITLSESHGVATIGLIAVAADSRGQGIGSALMDSAHLWMQLRKAREAKVVTQLANLPACHLYERSGYRLVGIEHYYHFWL
jgi:dTDP-4-amino-4,6-dideoxy-D-galactose acyltransferase